MSDPPEKHHPWSKYYSERGVSRPPMAALRQPPSPDTPGDGSPAAPESPSGNRGQSQPPISNELAAAVAAATTGLPGTTAAPFITILQREAVKRELRRQARIRWTRRGLLGLTAVVALHFAVTRLFYRAPSEAALQAYGESLARAVWPLYSSAEQPLAPAGVVVTMTDRISTSRIRYAAEVTLRLAQPLYVPATSNGTVAYRQMQQSLYTARERDLKFELFPTKGGPAAPEMPMLIQVAHRAGDPVTVRVPFEARRFGWYWRIEPAQLALRTANRSLEGTTIARYADVPHLIFGAPGTFADMRLRSQLARAYIIAVAKEIQKRADSQAIEAYVPDRSVADLPAMDPDQPAAEPSPADRLPKRSTDPNAPAVDPDAPAVDPNAPAVKLPAPVPPSSDGP